MESFHYENGTKVWFGKACVPQNLPALLGQYGETVMLVYGGGSIKHNGISYIIAGKTELDYSLALSKLKEKFHSETLMLGGGGVLNWSFLQAGMCDEISIVLAAAADGSPDTPPVFRAQKGLSENKALGFTLKEAKAMDGGSVWLRYTVQSIIFHRRLFL